MEATVLVPHPGGLHEVVAVRRPGPPSLELRGLPPERSRSTGDRIRAAVHNAGYTWPSGRVEVDAVPHRGIDVALGLAVLLADPAHEQLRQPGLVAWGNLNLDGTAGSCEPPGVGGLPQGPWVARFWHPCDRVPDPDEEAVLTLVEIPDLAAAWETTVGFLDLENRLSEVLAGAGPTSGR